MLTLLRVDFENIIYLLILIHLKYFSSQLILLLRGLFSCCTRSSQNEAI